MSWRHADVGWNKQISLSAGGNTQFICIIHPHVLGMSFAESYCRLYALLTEPFFFLEYAFAYGDGSPLPMQLAYVYDHRT